MAMIAVTLIVALAGGMAWQQQRAIAVEAAERARAQSSWILQGALDWSRLILREDGRTGQVDHEGEPWATPLAEARLSTFLAAEKGVADADAVGSEAFLSGSIRDAQARYNLRNLMAPEGKELAAEKAALTRLCATAGLGAEVAPRLVALLRRAWSADASSGSSGGDDPPLAIRRFEQLAWLGVEPAVISALRNSVDILPSYTPINLNTAPREVLAAVLDVDLGVAERLHQQRQRKPFADLPSLKPFLPPGAEPDAQRVAVATQFFEVSGRLRLDDRVLEERSLVQRKGTGSSTQVITLHRERRSLELGPS